MFQIGLDGLGIFEGLFQMESESLGLSQMVSDGIGLFKIRLVGIDLLKAKDLLREYILLKFQGIGSGFQLPINVTIRSFSLFGLCVHHYNPRFVYFLHCFLPTF